MANKFKVGDHVTLEGAGNVMTIKGQAKTHKADNTTDIDDRYECEWYDGKKMQRAVFAEHILRPAR